MGAAGGAERWCERRTVIGEKGAVGAIARSREYRREAQW
jgi:hypothetical protein